MKLPYKPTLPKGTLQLGVLRIRHRSPCTAAGRQEAAASRGPVSHVESAMKSRTYLSQSAILSAQMLLLCHRSELDNKSILQARPLDESLRY